MRMKPRHLLLALLAVIVLLLAGYRVLSPRLPQVATSTVESGPAVRVLAVNGRIRPRLQVDIRPVLGGEVIALPYDVGDRVAKGQVLARIDDAPEAAAIAEAEAAVEAQQAVLAQARRDLARYEALGEFVTRRDVEQRRLAVEEGERELKRRRAAKAQASELRERRILRAPFDGVILERPVDPGQMAGTDTVLYRLADLSDPEVSVEVDEIYATEIRPGTEAVVSLPGAQEAVNAAVVHIEPRVDPATGARDVRLRLREASVKAPSGLTVTVNLVIERRDNAISVPRAAILEADGRAAVRLVNDANTVEDRQIAFIDWPAEKVIVTRGLKAGERLLVNPDAARPGDRVRLRD